MGKTVAEQADAGYSQTWKRSAMYQAIKSDEELMNFTDLMARVVTADSNEKMQKYYQAVSAYYNDPGHSENVEKIRACLDKAIEAMSVDKTSVQEVLNLQNDGMAKRALSGETEASRAEESAMSDVDPDLPPLPKLVGDHLSKEEFIAGKFKSQVWYLTWPQTGYL